MDAPGRLSLRLPKKGAKWHGSFKSMAEVMTAAAKDITPPFTVEYVLPENKNSG
ncbi:hypothetical protein SAMN05216548_11458 [Faunimonas pinastri]|uniref:Uncharacterized protein n=1 Tax=Faunimonas pinastri TaxID=1855383 RepID=A0A1H9MUN2_9HYPH|nr:hypothetical protein [Faunimonas pinastri]SER27416.1 hypothetical protein SAMN05216548_11458 [Faunimonas pinastri]